MDMRERHLNYHETVRKYELGNEQTGAARLMLAGTDDAIGCIADECGSTDFSNFSRIFKRVTGCSPSEYRDKCK